MKQRVVGLKLRFCSCTKLLRVALVRARLRLDPEDNNTLVREVTRNLYVFHVSVFD